jgi:hypothetical protein
LSECGDLSEVEAEETEVVVKAIETAAMSRTAVMAEVT